MGVEYPLRWPQGQSRTLIGNRQDARVWKKPFIASIEVLMKEMKKMGIDDFVITVNQELNQKQDPGVAVYWSATKDRDHSWQSILDIENSLPSRKEIEDAFVKKALPYHTDRPDGGDPVLFKQYNEAKQKALAWIMGTSDNEADRAIACDHFKEPRWNVMAIRQVIEGLRRLERFGIPGIVDRALSVRGQLTEGSDGK